MDQTTIGNLTIFYSNLAELHALEKEIFSDEEYKTELTKPNPLIIDCGSHIGLSILYFKKHYPQAKIISFEPDPANFEILKRNIEVNKFTNVISVNAALASREGTTNLFIASDQNHYRNWSWHNTTVSDYRRGNQQQQIAAVKLSSYLQGPVDLIKMDIEGAELEVLCEIEPQLNKVSQIILEYHGLPNSKTNKFSDVLKILKRNFSNVSVIDKKKTNGWRWEFFKKTGFPLFRIKNPYYFIIKARR